MKALRTKVILSAFVLLFALVATIGSTYAWFTVSTTVTVPSLTLHVKSAKSLLIRPYYADSSEEGEDGTESYLQVPANYYTSLTTDNITTVPTTDAAYVFDNGTTTPYASINTWTLNNVTAIQNLSSPMLTGNLDGTDLQVMNIDSKVLSSSLQQNEGSATGDYVDLKFWLFSQVTSEDIVLQDLVITGDAANAVGVAVYEEGESALIYSIDPDYGFVFTAGMTGYDGDATDYIVADDKTTLLGDHALFYDSVSGAVANISAASLGGSDVITTLSLDTPTLIHVVVYLEGWDADTTNDILAADFSISFIFALQDV